MTQPQPEATALRTPLPEGVRHAAAVSAPSLKSPAALNHVLTWRTGEDHAARFRLRLYRFLAANIPAVNACVWTWVRLAAAPGRFEIENNSDTPVSRQAKSRLDDLAARLYTDRLGRHFGIETFLPDLFTSLFRDGSMAGFLTVRPDASGVDRFIPVDPSRITTADAEHDHALFLELDNSRLRLDRPDFYFLPLGSGITEPLGRSILHTVPFIAWIEQQLVDDMRRTSHNSGYHRLHVKIEPPERMSGESDTAYTDRINGYFDDTVRMIKSCEVDENPVTWNNVLIEHIGPDKSREVSNSWFMNHRAMIEEICAGTNLAPYLLGYSYGATTTWSGLKFDVVMRQVRSVQAEMSRFLEWIGGIDLAMAGLDVRCRFVFDNTFAYQAADHARVEASRVDNLLKLYQAGLLDDTIARTRARDLI